VSARAVWCDDDDDALGHSQNDDDDELTDWLADRDAWSPANRPDAAKRDDATQSSPAAAGETLRRHRSLRRVTDWDRNDITRQTTERKTHTVFPAYVG